MISEMEELMKVTETLKERALETHRRNLEESRVIAQKIDQIDTLRTQAQQDDQGLVARRSIGADTLWLSWLMRRRAELLQESARARAKETDSLDVARTAFARARASQDIRDAELEQAKQRVLRREAERLEEIGSLRQSL